jgi:hypothetical protein
MCYGSSEFDPEMTDEEIEEAEQAERDYWEEAELDYCQQRFKSSGTLSPLLTRTAEPDIPC